MADPINVLDYESLAKDKLSPMAWDYYAGGSGDELTVRGNRDAFSRYRLRPRMLIDVSRRDLRVSILGRTCDAPILIAPTAFHCLAHTDGELATARAASATGTLMVLSTLSTKTLEDVAVAGGSGLRWFQLYVHRDRGLTRALVERAEAAGYAALCLTVDAPLLGVRERDRRNSFSLPKGLQLANLTRVAVPKVEGESALFAYVAHQFDPSLTWSDIDWLRSITKLPVAVKGILRGDDARLGVEHGASAIVVSNHGGRQLDGAVATIDAIADVCDSVAGKVEVLMDGGIRRGTDVLKALALGARAVLVGRPVLWGLAAGGEAGVVRVLQILREELDAAMALCGCPTLKDIDASLIARH